MPRIAVWSDLHLEFAPWTPPKTGADFALLAGDIYTKSRCFPAGFGEAQQVFGCPVLAVLGNHEHYQGKVDRTLTKMRPAAEQAGVQVLECEEVVLSGTRVLGCTLWTDFRLFAGDDDAAMRADAAACAQRLTDFQAIRVSKDGYRRFSPQDAARLHKASVEWLCARLATPFDGPTVVMTHHAPSLRSIPARYQADRLSAGFASRLDGVIAQFQPALWVHGHIHDSLDYQIGQTRVICNPRGYIPDEPNPAFDQVLVVEV
jgi:hypothetical protein